MKDNTSLYHSLLKELQRDEFKSVDNEVDLKFYLNNNFKSTEDKIEFLKYIYLYHATIIDGGPEFIPPDLVQELRAPSGLYGYNDPYDVYKFLREVVPNVKTYYEYIHDKEPKPLNFDSKVRVKKLRKIIDDLVLNDIIKEEPNSSEIFDYLTANNVHEVKGKIYFLIDIKAISYFFEEHFIKLFRNMNRATIEESQLFVQNDGKKLVKSTSIRDGKGKTFSDSVKNKIDSIFNQL